MLHLVNIIRSNLFITSSLHYALFAGTKRYSICAVFLTLIASPPPERVTRDVSHLSRVAGDERHARPVTIRPRGRPTADWCGECAYTVVMPTPAETRHDRLHLRLSSTDDGLIRAAAAAANLSLTEFVVRAARTSATDLLADRDHVVLDAKAWDQLDARVARQGKRNPAVAELFSRATPTTD